MIKLKNEEIIKIIDNYDKKEKKINEVSEDIKDLLKEKSANSFRICKLRAKDSMEITNCPKVAVRKKFIEIDYNDSKLLEEFKKITTKNFKH